MSSTILTQTELDEYLSTLDLGNPAVARILNSIQLLSPRYYNDLLYYMVSGKIQLSQLESVSINNGSVAAILAGAEAGGDTALSLRRKYEGFLKSLSGWGGVYAASAPSVLYRLSLPSKELVPSVLLDLSKIDPNAYHGTYEVRSMYADVLASTEVQTALSTLSTQCSAAGLPALANIVTRELSQGILLQTSNNSIVARIDPLQTLSGFCLRELHHYPWQVQFSKALGYSLGRMVEKSHEDPGGTGVPGVRAAMADPWNSWTSIGDSVVPAADVIAKFGTVAFLRKALVGLYGASEFTLEEYQAEIAAYNSVKAVFDGVRDSLRLVLTKLEGLSTR